MNIEKSCKTCVYGKEKANTSGRIYTCYIWDKSEFYYIPIWACYKHRFKASYLDLFEKITKQLYF